MAIPGRQLDTVSLLWTRAAGFRRQSHAGTEVRRGQCVAGCRLRVCTAAHRPLLCWDQMSLRGDRTENETRQEGQTEVSRTRTMASFKRPKASSVPKKPTSEQAAALSR